MPEKNRQFLMTMHDGQSYVVQFTLSCVPYKTKRFKASEHGGMLKAKSAALAWRDQQLAEDPKLGGTEVEASDVDVDADTTDVVEPSDATSSDTAEVGAEVETKAVDDKNEETAVATDDTDDKPAAKKEKAEKKDAKPPVKRKKSEKTSKAKAPAEDAETEKPVPSKKKSKAKPKAPAAEEPKVEPVDDKTAESAVETKAIETKTVESKAVESKAVEPKPAETKTADAKASVVDEPQQGELEFVDPADLGHVDPDLLFDIIDKTPPTIMIKADVEGMTRRVNVATKGWHKAIEQAYSRGYKILNKVEPQAASIPEYAPDGGLLDVLQELQKANILNDKWEPIK